jgi:hypothetical protein
MTYDTGTGTGHECARLDRDSQIPVSATEMLLSQDHRVQRHLRGRSYVIPVSHSVPYVLPEIPSAVQCMVPCIPADTATPRMRRMARITVAHPSIKPASARPAPCSPVRLI